ncbi:enoyl-CoA hydratase/isomerase family protein [Cupriavidus sp. WS]|uniref:enoyl-CoA hydratase/isomerase family protein n=1 Tax=Cupriavidus sp. WS TaxID=1312922 RepID=UPI0003810D3B|nr:enoyl-CoA hydratase-related protein [Cupriavidus sp. WS]
MNQLINAPLETLKLSQLAGPVVQVSINRPEAANAINTRMGEELTDVFTRLAAGREQVRAIVLTAEGDRHFCAGGDLKERNGMTDADFLRQHAIYERMVLAIMDCPVPVIAAVNGAAFAGGCELALACDFVYAGDNARFALTETSLGIMPGCGGTQNLARAVGTRRAKELILGAMPFSAQDACEWGLVNKICPDHSVKQEAAHIAQRIAANAPLSVYQAKRAIDHGARMDSRTAMFFEVEAYNRLVPTADRLEGIAAFNEKRKPVFTGR